MKNQLASLAFLAQKIDRQQIQLILAIVSLDALLLGTGAPLDGGEVGK